MLICEIMIFIDLLIEVFDYLYLLFILYMHISLLLIVINPLCYGIGTYFFLSFRIAIEKVE